MHLRLAFAFFGGACALPSAQADDAALWAVIQNDANVVLVTRHTATGRGNGTVLDPGGHCRGELMLSSLGREQAQVMGRVFRDQGVAPERLQVVASSMCRTRDTALLAFGQAELDPALRETFSGAGGGLNTFMDAAEAWIVRLRGPRPVVIVTHLPNVDALTGQQIDYGDVLVTRSDEVGGLSLVGRLRLPVPR
jgi:hypothetical protein